MISRRKNYLSFILNNHRNWQLLNCARFSSYLNYTIPCTHLFRLTSYEPLARSFIFLDLKSSRQLRSCYRFNA